jgi:hypothetical protein
MAHRLNFVWPCRDVSLHDVAQLRAVVPAHLDAAWVDVAATMALPFLVDEHGGPLPSPPPERQLRLRFGHESLHRRPAPAAPPGTAAARCASPFIGTHTQSAHVCLCLCLSVCACVYTT